MCGSEDLGIDVLAGLDELADQSLLRRMPDFEEPRLLMLQVVREYAADRLQESGDAETTKDRHAAAYQALAEAAAPKLFGPDRKKWLDRLELDHDNFRAAFDWAIARGDPRRALSLGAAFWRFWQMRGHLSEGKARLETTLAMPGTGEYPSEKARALEAAGGVAYWQGNMDAAQAKYDESLVLVRAEGDRRRLANALYNASFPRVVDRSNLPDALRLVEEALSIYREVGDELGIARSQWAIGNLLYFGDSQPEAAVALDEAIALNRKVDDRFSLGWALHTRSLVALKQHDPLPDPALGFVDRDDDQLFLRVQTTYAAAVTYADAALGVFFEAFEEQGLGAKTLVIVTSDSGLSLAQASVTSRASTRAATGSSR